jgi:rubrerythrin
MSPEFTLILLMGVAIVVFVAQPLVMGAVHSSPTNAAGQDFERLSVQKETLYAAISDLDFDFQTGKVDREDYAAMRHRLEAEALQILRHIDRIDPLAELDSELERQILALRHVSPPPPSPSTPMVSCIACGVRLHGNENFCPVCGHSQGSS